VSRPSPTEGPAEGGGVVAYKLKLSYDGTNYHGWQRQPDRRTVQGALEDAIFKLTRRRVSVSGAGRTDAGVHALEQVAGFRLRPTMGNREFFKALNAVLPADIRINSLAKAPVEFHPRRSARSKVYEYRILNTPRVDPFRLRYVLHWPHPLDLRAMQKAAALFEREADFSAFSSNRELHPVRTILRSRLRREGDEIVYSVKADGFLRYMVRTIVGTLLEVGRGKIPPEKVEELFRERARTLHSPTAPAKGLCLMKVFYGPRTRPMTQASSTGLV
jgi:tRNA pseudouridine38-40 synthase